MYEPAIDAQVPRHVVPRGPDLVRNGRFEDGLAHWDGTARTETAPSAGGLVRVAVLSNQKTGQTSDLMQWIPRRDGQGDARFTAREAVACLFRVRAAQFGRGSWFSGSISADGDRWIDLQVPVARDTAAQTVDGSGFHTVVRPEVKLPFGIRGGLWLRLRLTGPGRVEVAQAALYSAEATQRLLEGSYEVPRRSGERLSDNDTARVFLEPDAQWGIGRLWYDLRSYTAWKIWGPPIGTWALLWLAMFLAMYACAAMFFWQWSDHEKLNCPLTLIPLHLTEADEERGAYLPRLLRSRPLWLGALTAMGIYGLNGLHFYNSNFPGLTMAVDLEGLLDEPPWNALVADGQGFALRLTLLAVGVAFLMEGHMSFNFWFFFLLCKALLLVPYYQGRLDGSAWPGGSGGGSGSGGTTADARSAAAHGPLRQHQPGARRGARCRRSCCPRVPAGDRAIRDCPPRATEPQCRVHRSGGARPGVHRRSAPGGLVGRARGPDALAAADGRAS